MIGNGVAVRIAADLGERPLHAGGSGGLADVDFLDQRVSLLKAVLDDRRQRIEIGLAGVDRAEQIDDALRPADFPQEMLGRTVFGRRRRLRGRKTAQGPEPRSRAPVSKTSS